MSFQRVPLLANVSLDMGMAGTVLLLDSTGDASDISIQIVKGGAPGKAMQQREAGFRYEGQFESVILTSDVDTVVTIFISYENVQISTNKLEISNPDARAIPIRTKDGERIDVNIDGGTVNVTADNVGINNANAAAIPTKKQALGTIVDFSVASIDTGAAQLLVSDATLRVLRITNASNTATVAIGGAALTLANATILLLPGEGWSEDDAPGAAWYAVSTEDDADVRIQGLK